MAMSSLQEEGAGNGLSCALALATHVLLLPLREEGMSTLSSQGSLKEGTQTCLARVFPSGTP